MPWRWWPPLAFNHYVETCGLGGWALFGRWCTSLRWGNQLDAHWMMGPGRLLQPGSPQPHRHHPVPRSPLVLPSRRSQLGRVPVHHLSLALSPPAPLRRPSSSLPAVCTPPLQPVIRLAGCLLLQYRAPLKWPLPRPFSSHLSQPRGHRWHLRQCLLGLRRLGCQSLAVNAAAAARTMLALQEV